MANQIENVNDFSLSKIHTDIQRILLEKCNTTQLSAEFRALTSNDKRVHFTSDFLRTHNILPEIVHVEKCDEKSEDRRKYGNHVFIALKKDHVAMKHYNKSIAYAKSKETLALAFANRSAVLFENRFYKECIQDIEYAMENGYPERLHAKINERKQKAEKQLEEINYKVHEEYHTKVPTIIGLENEIFECASNCIAMKESEIMGRHIVAIEKIEPGDVIAVEKPYIKILLYDCYLTHCHHCLNISYNLIPCLQCPLTLYCSEKCRVNSWEQYHKYECALLGTLQMIEATKLHLLALRVVISARNEYKQIIAGDFTVKHTEKYKSESYKEIHNLVTNDDKRPVKKIFSSSVVAAILMYLLEATNFFDFYDSGDLEKIKNCTAELLLRHLHTAPSNMHGITEMQGNKKDEFATIYIGAGAYAFLSLLNHSCSPNVVRNCYGTTIVLRALRPIEIGQQLFDNYGYHHAIMEREERRTELRDQYCFVCQCEACTDDWPMYKDLPTSDADAVLSHDQLNKLLAGSRETAEELIPQLVDNAKDFEKYFNNYYFLPVLDNQEILKQCFSLIGNKHSLF